MNNLIKGKTCFKADSGISVDFMLTNRPRSFHKTSIIETGFSHHHNMIVSFFRTYFERFKSKKLEYRNYRKFEKTKFLCELDQELLNGKMYKTQNNMFTTFTDVFRSVIDKHAPYKVIRGNQAPFMTKELSKAIMTRS